MEVPFSEILNRIAVIDRDIAELNRLKSRLPADRPYSPTIQLTFDKQINTLLNERVSLMELPILHPPLWLLSKEGLEPSVESSVLKERRSLLAGDLSVPHPNEQDVINFIREIPKTEVHLHLEACVNKETLKFLYKKNGIEVTDKEFEDKYNFKDLNGFIQVFFFVQGSVKEASDLGYFIDSLAEYLRSNNIIYCVSFFCSI